MQKGLPRGGQKVLETPLRTEKITIKSKNLRRKNENLLGEIQINHVYLKNDILNILQPAGDPLTGQVVVTMYG